MLDDAAFPAIQAMAAQLGVPPAWVLLVLYLESRLQTNPAGNPSYAGLSQVNAGYLPAYGLSRAEYVALPASQQIQRVIAPWYVSTQKNYLGHTASSPGVLYALNLAPGVVASKGDAEGVVLYANPAPGYVKNSNLDVSRDGTITIGDLDAYMANLATQRPFQEALRKLEAGGVASPVSATRLVEWALAAGALGFVGWHAYQAYDAYHR